jgi:hypothetical protein
MRGPTCPAEQQDIQAITDRLDRIIKLIESSGGPEVDMAYRQKWGEILRTYREYGPSCVDGMTASVIVDTMLREAGVRVEEKP